MIQSDKATFEPLRGYETRERWNRLDTLDLFPARTDFRGGLSYNIIILVVDVVTAFYMG